MTDPDPPSPPPQCRLQAGAPAGHAVYTGPLDVIRRIVRNEGRMGAGLWRGLGATLVREIPGNTIFFTVYEGDSTGLLRHQPTRSKLFVQHTVRPIGRHIDVAASDRSAYTRGIVRLVAVHAASSGWSAYTRGGIRSVGIYLWRHPISRHIHGAYLSEQPFPQTRRRPRDHALSISSPGEYLGGGLDFPVVEWLNKGLTVAWGPYCADAAGAAAAQKAPSGGVQ
eukprot:885516-Prorocentrum_minimum.AAC.2